MFFRNLQAFPHQKKQQTIKFAAFFYQKLAQRKP